MARDIKTLIVLIISIILVLATIFFIKEQYFHKINFVGTYQIGSFNIYVYNIYGKLYACTQNISGEQCLVAKNTLLCGDTSCVEIYAIVNIT
jgi:hypothetical protein